MIQGPLLIDTSRQRKLIPLPAPTLLITLEPRGQVFFRNLKDLLWRRPKAPLVLVSRPATFWEDVFVVSPWPWTRFLQSAAAHLALIAVMFAWTRFAPQLWPQPTQIVQRNVFHSSDVDLLRRSRVSAAIEYWRNAITFTEEGRTGACDAAHHLCTTRSG